MPHPVAQLAPRQNQNGCEQQVRVNTPLQLKRGSSQIFLNGRECNRQDTHIDKDHRQCRHDGEQPPPFLVLADGHGFISMKRGLYVVPRCSRAAGGSNQP